MGREIQNFPPTRSSSLLSSTSPPTTYSCLPPAHFHLTFTHSHLPLLQFHQSLIRFHLPLRQLLPSSAPRKAIRLQVAQAIFSITIHLQDSPVSLNSRMSGRLRILNNCSTPSFHLLQGLPRGPAPSAFYFFLTILTLQGSFFSCTNHRNLEASLLFIRGAIPDLFHICCFRLCLYVFFKLLL